MAIGSKIQPGRGRFKHGWIELKFGLDILFILGNSWFNYIGDQRKSPKNETPYCGVMTKRLSQGMDFYIPSSQVFTY